MVQELQEDAQSEEEKGQIIITSPWLSESDLLFSLIDDDYDRGSSEFQDDSGQSDDSPMSKQSLDSF
jgi:hypothetical protein